MVKEIFKSFADDILDHKGAVSSVVCAFGTLATFIFTVKANKVANERRHVAQAEKGECLTTKEIFAAEAPAYILPGGIALATMVFEIFIGIKLDKETHTILDALTATGALYAGRIKAEKDIGVENKVRAELIKHVEPEDDIPKGYERFYDELRETYFVEKFENMYNADVELNRIFAYKGYATANDYYKLLNNRSLPPDNIWDFYAWAKWHKNEIDGLFPVFIDIVYTQIGEGDNKYYLVEFVNRPSVIGLGSQK